MQDKSDSQLLNDFAGRGEEAAFREIVGRYADLVYSAALRQVESSAAAADIAESVFTDLARKAGTLATAGDLLPPDLAGRLHSRSNAPRSGGGSRQPSLAGWLHRATRYAALNHLRDARRRHTNERQAMEQLLTNSDSAVNWEQIRPALDEALDSLAEDDREALLLRYFKNQDFRAVGAALGVSDDAAQKRVSRAVEQLREFFSKHDVTIGASGLALLLSANAVQSAPVGLVATISTAVLSGTAVTAAATTSSAVAVTKTIAMTTLQKTIVTIALAALAGTELYEVRQASHLRQANQALQQVQATQAGQIQALQRERDAATYRLAESLAENSRLKSNPDKSELVKLRGQASQAHTAVQELAKMNASAGQQTAVMPALFTNAMARGMAMAEKFKKKDAVARIARMKDKLHLTDDQAQQAGDILLKHIEESSQQMLKAISGGQMAGGLSAAIQSASNEESEIKALLTAGQLAAYPDYEQSELQVAAENSAKSESSVMTADMELTPDQQEQVRVVLYQYHLNQKSPAQTKDALAEARASGKLADVITLQMAKAKQALDDKLKLLDGILTADQLRAYKQKQMDQLDMQAGAIKMFLPASTNTMTQ